jgi:hypothetical protein
MMQRYRFAYGLVGDPLGQGYSDDSNTFYATDIHVDAVNKVEARIRNALTYFTAPLGDRVVWALEDGPVTLWAEITELSGDSRHWHEFRITERFAKSVAA